MHSTRYMPGTTQLVDPAGRRWDVTQAGERRLTLRRGMGAAGTWWSAVHTNTEGTIDWASMHPPRRQR